MQAFDAFFFRAIEVIRLFLHSLLLFKDKNLKSDPNIVLEYSNLILQIYW